MIGPTLVVRDGGVPGHVDPSPGGDERAGGDHADAQKEEDPPGRDQPLLAAFVAEDRLPTDVDEQRDRHQHDAREGDLIPARCSAAGATVPGRLARAENEQRDDAPEVAKEGRQVPGRDGVALVLTVPVGPGAEVDAVHEHEAETGHQPVRPVAGARLSAGTRVGHDGYRRLPVNGLTSGSPG